MKTYTIRPLEWELIEGSQILMAQTHIGYFTISGDSRDYCPVRFVSGPSSSYIGDRATIAAAKELAWQDWLRRLTPALEEVK